MELHFELAAHPLIFSASRQAPALIHPAAQSGQFQPELWMYDVVEFFIATADGSRYMEFNLCPNGAWWAESFSAPRVIDETAPSLYRSAVAATGRMRPAAWECRAAFPFQHLRALGIYPPACRLAVCPILHSPSLIFLTTAEVPT